MQYIYGKVKRGGVEFENVKTVGDSHSDLKGSQSITRKYDDSYITDNFEVVEKYRSEEVEDAEGVLFYDWYLIKNHYRYEDKFTPGIGATEQEITDLEIESMEQAQAITDNEIAIMELQGKLNQE